MPLEILQNFVTFNNNKAHKRNFVGVWDVTIGGLFFELYPYILKGHNVFNSIPFLMIFNALEASIGGV